MKQTNKLFQGDTIFYIIETGTSTTKKNNQRCWKFKYHSKIFIVTYEPDV